MDAVGSCGTEDEDEEDCCVIWGRGGTFLLSGFDVLAMRDKISGLYTSS